MIVSDHKYSDSTLPRSKPLRGRLQSPNFGLMLWRGKSGFKADGSRLQAGLSPDLSDRTRAVQSQSRNLTQKIGEVKLIGLDWGTSTLRTYLFGNDGVILRENSIPLGIMPVRQTNTPEQFDVGHHFLPAFLTAVGDWIRECPNVAIIAGGMVGSTLGWREAKYLNTPFNLRKLGADLYTLRISRGVNLHIVPGIMKKRGLTNVMRGEETQALGIWAMEDNSKARAKMLVCLPGTHSKWCKIQNGRIANFETFMTGELYTAIRERAILGQTLGISGDLPPSEAFDRGVQVARGAQGKIGLSSTLFSVRSLQLAGQLTSEEQAEYLSGLLIGHEIRGVKNWLESKEFKQDHQPPIRLSGKSSLCLRYLRALSTSGIDNAKIVANASPVGLWLVAVQAGLVRETSKTNG